jgi:nucleoside-diphosphate-sugar epimerase
MRESNGLPPNRVLVVGCGYVGSRLAALLVDEGVEVWGAKRDPAGLPTGVRPVAVDVTVPRSLAALPSPVDAVIYAVAPGASSPEAYRAAYVDGLRNTLAAVGDGARRLVLVSSTGVYGHDDGRWVDEESSPEPADATARLILEGEGIAVGSRAPGVVLRLGGIYGPGRTRTVRQVLSGAAPCLPPNVYGNRIHRDDAAAAVRHLLVLADPASVYLGVDREPAPLRDVYSWIAQQGGIADPCDGRDTAEAESGTGRRGTNKRCSSRRLVDSGFIFRYPTFREGYEPLLDEARP